MIRHGTENRRQGGSLVEVVMGLTILTVGLLSIMVSLLSAHSSVRSTALEDQAWLALEDTREQMRGWDFSRLYADFDGRQFKTEQLRGSSGDPGIIEVTCYVNELTVPAVFGRIADLDGVGGLETADCSTSYKLLPVELSLTWEGDDGEQTREYFFIIGPDA